MSEINCLLKEKTFIEDKEFYIVQEIVSKEEHFIPVDQIDIFSNIIINKTYQFVKEFNINQNKAYLSIIHPKYKLSEEINFNIIGKQIFDDKIYFKLESEYQDVLTVRAFKWQENFKNIKCKVVGYKRGKPVLKNIDTTNKEWAIGEIKSFIITGYGKYIDNKGNEVDCIKLKIGENNDLDVRAGKWHKLNLWNFKDVKCKIVSILQNGKPKLIINDDRHPYYKKGETYKFLIKGFQDKISYAGSNYKIIILSDKFDDIHEVFAIPNQENKLKIGQEIECEISEINSKLHLRQINSEDPFYFDFEEIIEDGEIKNKYFSKYLNDDDEFNLKLKSQYEQKSAFWVLTYCNHILNRIKGESSNRKNLVEVLEILELHTKIEDWILKKGILKAINNDDERKLIKKKTLEIIKNNTSEKYAIQSIIDFKVKEFYESQKISKNFKEIFYLIKHLNFAEINEIEFLNLLESIGKIDTANAYYIKKLILQINRSLKVFKSSLQQDYFILSQNLEPNQEKSIIKYVNWLYIEFFLSTAIGLTEEANILLSKFYRFNTFLSKDVNINRKLLLNSFYIISNTNKTFKIPINVLANKIEISYDDIEENPNQGNPIDISQEVFRAHITEKHYQGYKLIIDSTPGFLPIQNITDLNLKNYEPNKIDWVTSIAITLYCEKFNHFVAKQINPDSKDYFSKNTLEDKIPKKGEIIYGTIKNITVFDSNSFGVFVSTEYGDGLIHENYITNSSFEKGNLLSLFNKGDKIPVYILNYRENKLELSLVDLIGTKFEKEYYDIFKFYGLDNLDDISEEEFNYSYRIELEKGFIFEYYAIFQSSIEEKIKYIKFAKAFFSNTKNARSYLLNIYIEYFNSLQKLDELISNYTFKKYNLFRDYIIQIKEKVQPVTMENFPESKNLLFFIDILYLFNSKSEVDLEVLFDLTKKPIKENNILLKAVAKTVLANNLIISEIDDTNDENLDQYTLKNLRRIREYISQGVLSVKETVEDKLAKELNEKRIYWRKMIDEDEGEKLEFKATLITPVPSNEKARIIDSLEKQLKKSKDEINIRKIKDKINDILEPIEQENSIEKIIMHSALKTICAFANTSGGYLLLGVSDDKKIFGLEQDYNSFKKNKNRDEFGKYFDSMLKDYFGDSFSSSLLEKEFLKFPEGDILIIKVNKSLEEVFLLKNENGVGEENLYVRNLSSSIKLKGIELSKFLKRRFKQQLFDNSN